MKYKGSKIGLGIVLILLSLFTVKDINFSTSEAVGFSLVPILLIAGGIYSIYRGFKKDKQVESK